MDQHKNIHLLWLFNLPKLDQKRNLGSERGVSSKRTNEGKTTVEFLK